MGCANCSAGGCGVSIADSAEKGKVAGCKGSGGCSCNRMNTFDWLSDLEIPDYQAFDVVEVSFKNGSRKEFFINRPQTGVITGDNVVVEAGTGYDVGTVTLSGELVRLQMKKKKVSLSQDLPSVVRKANERDFERLKEARALEKETMIKARAIARTLKLDMKIGDVEYQGDKRKATFLYTADGRVDFRELIKEFAKEFRVKIEMRQIGARQESARIGGLGACGRELCCSTWLADFKSVSTAAARYQNLAINQSKLSGQCGRLKCCLNYELDTYMDALADFPKKADHLLTEVGKATLIKTDIFKRIMYYQYRDGKNGKVYALDLDRVKVILGMNAENKKPVDLQPLGYETEDITAQEPDYEAVNEVFELSPAERQKRKRKGKNKKAMPQKSGIQETRPMTETPDKAQASSATPAERNAEKTDEEQKAGKAKRSRNRRKPNAAEGGNPAAPRQPKTEQKPTPRPEKKVENKTENKGEAKENKPENRSENRSENRPKAEQKPVPKPTPKPKPPVTEGENPAENAASKAKRRRNRRKPPQP